MTNVARASLEELKLDYEDFLRQRKLPLWDRTDPRRQSLIDRRCTTADDVAQWAKEQKGSGRGGRQEGGQSGAGGEMPSSSSSTQSSSTYPELAANAALILLAVACSLLDRQLASQAEEFEKHGGFSERLTAKRLEARERERPPSPDCPLCGKSMRRRTSGRGDFWGCSAFPECKGTRPV